MTLTPHVMSDVPPHVEVIGEGVDDNDAHPSCHVRRGRRRGHTSISSLHEHTSHLHMTIYLSISSPHEHTSHLYIYIIISYIYISSYQQQKN